MSYCILAERVMDDSLAMHIYIQEGVSYGEVHCCREGAAMQRRI